MHVKYTKCRYKMYEMYEMYEIYEAKEIYTLNRIFSEFPILCVSEKVLQD